VVNTLEYHRRGPGSSPRGICYDQIGTEAGFTCCLNLVNWWLNYQLFYVNSMF